MNPVVPYALVGRLFTVIVVWTLGLLTLGGIVHATGSSLACPDWPLCFGQVMPRMVGGVFWEHLHRLVAGALILMWTWATWLVRRRRLEPLWLEGACWGGLALLIVQAVFGGLTVIYRLPDAVSTTHLGLALVFLALATVAASVTGWWSGRRLAWDGAKSRVSRPAAWIALAAFLQCLVGGLVRHMDAGTACPDVPLCQGRLVPVFADPLVTLHFIHRVLGVAVFVAVIWLAVRVTASARRGLTPVGGVTWAWATMAIAVAQLTLGVLSVVTRLSVETVSLHTLGAALLVMTLVRLSILGTGERGSPSTLITPPTGEYGHDTSR